MIEQLAENKRARRANGQFAGVCLDPDARFLARLKATETGCLEYTGNRTAAGYGTIGINRKPHYAHRYAWERVNGPIPAGLYICHRCDNPSCCNIEHLFLGTPSDNMRDMDAKGRRVPTGIFGEAHKLAKLTEGDVAEIRKQYDPSRRRNKDCSQQALADRYGVARSLIARIVKGQAWPHTAVR